MDRTIMGILNVTPDSFSDGAAFFEVDDAVAQGRTLQKLGADVIDVGGESSRPGANPVSADEELARIMPVVQQLVADGVTVSVDTTKSTVAEKALAVGAQIINDISGGTSDPELLNVVAMYDARLIVMHMQGDPQTMQENPSYENVVLEVVQQLRACVKLAIRAGIDRDKITVDPGIGFGKSTSHNLALFGALKRMNDALGLPMVLGASRKSFIASVLQDGSEPLDREEATQALTVWAFTHGVDMVRVHNVAAADSARRVLQGVAA